MKRVREPPEFNDVGIFSLILESEMVDIGECVFRAALSSTDYEVLEGAWMLHKTCTFWNRYLTRLLPQTLFLRVDQELAKIKLAYEKWGLDHPLTEYSNFPWWRTDSDYSGAERLKIYRPMFVAWARSRYPHPIETTIQSRLRAHFENYARTQAWCVQAVLDESSDYPELNMATNHVIPIVLRIMQISFRLATDIIFPILCVTRHEEILPILLYYLASCTMKSQYYSDEFGRHGLEMEIADTAYIKKRYKRERKLDGDCYADVLLPLKYLYSQ
jgi:hypothetical protein